MHFEKWQALGNDYVIVEERELPFELTPGRVRAICAPHTGVGSDGILLIRETDERGFVAEVRIYNPDGSEAELSGNGVRQAVMYLRRNGWTEQRLFSVLTAAGEIRPRIDGRPLHDGHGPRAPARRAGLPERERGRHGHSGVARAASSRFQFVQVGNPQCRSRCADGLDELDLGRYGPEIERPRAVPEPHQRVVLAPQRRRARSTRASSSAAWGRRCPPAPAPPARPWRPCCAAWTAR